ncbi:MAG: hypothetical protein ACREUU_03220, partial [Gammaproteobacteria bacterium]
DVAEFEFSIAIEPPRKLELRSEPVLRFSNPIRNVDDAAVFVIHRRQRPELIATVMSYRDGKRNLRRAYEFLSLSEDRLDASRSDVSLWHSEKAGVQWRDLPDAPPPAETAAERRRQMQRLAEKFQVAVRSDRNRYELRLLSQPLYRYENAKADILDGALYALVEGTDPELVLALESPVEKPNWRFACGRLTRWEIEVRFQDTVVGEFPQIKGARDAADDADHISDGGPLDPAPAARGETNKSP